MVNKKSKNPKLDDSAGAGTCVCKDMVGTFGRKEARMERTKNGTKNNVI